MRTDPTARILIAALAWALFPAAPAAAQKGSPDALTYATAAYRARESVSKVAPELRTKFRQTGESVARTLLSAGFPASDVAAQLVSADRESAGATVAWLVKSGMDREGAWTAVRRFTREAPDRTAADALREIGDLSRPALASWGTTFRTAGLTAIQIGGIYRQIGADPRETAATLKESGSDAKEVANALHGSTPPRDIIEILFDIGFRAPEVAEAAAESLLALPADQMIEITVAISQGKDLIERVAAVATTNDLSPEDVATELTAIGVVIETIIAIVAVVVTFGALAGGLVALNVPQLITVVAIALGLGTAGPKVAEFLHANQVKAEDATAALVANLPLDETIAAMHEGYGLGAKAAAEAAVAAGAFWPDVIAAVYDEFDSFATTVGIVPPTEFNSADVMSALFQVFAVATAEQQKDKAFWLYKAGMSGANLVRGLRDEIGLDAGEIAQLLVQAGLTSPTALAQALLDGGFTQPIVIAQALKDAGFTLDQVQSAMMSVLTLPMQQLSEILATVFGG